MKNLNTNDRTMNQNGASGTIRQMIEMGAAFRSEQPAIKAPGVPVMTFQGLADQAAAVREDLANLGLGAGNRIAIALPSDVALANCFLTVAAAATAAPLNIAYRADEFDYLIKNLSADALIVDEAFDTPTRDHAARLGIPVIAMRPRTAASAGGFELYSESDTTLSEGAVNPVKEGAAPGRDDIALILHTSGTTSQPKIVPLSHANLMASARNISDCYQLGEDDVCLNLMPLFHIHGLVAGLLAPLWSGGTAVCPPSFTPDGFFAWLEVFSPTWYTAVPTMHQAILRRAPSYAKAVEASRLRFVRSSSAAIPEMVAAQIEDLFGAPLLEAYSMTEATHQITSSPLPPGERKARSVGLPTGVELTILDKEGTELKQGQIGEVAIRGPTVITAYERNPTANESAFVNGWFRTGDQGVLDPDGYLTLTGRLKELIIRGGQNIAPAEVEEALLSHPEVARAVCFAMPHDSLGEDVAVAVVLEEWGAASEADLRRHVAGLLANFKVPRRVLYLDELPKGPTGKLQRIGLAERLGLDVTMVWDISGQDADNMTDLERRIAAVWADELALEHVGLDDDYFYLGGDSLQAVAIFLKLEELFAKPLPSTILYEASTVREMARWIEADCETRCLVPIRQSNEGPAFFCVHPLDGEVFGFTSIVRHLKEKCSFYGLQPVGRNGKSLPLQSVEEMAARYIDEIRTVLPKGPYYLGGYSFGGLVAYEMAQRLQAEGEKIMLLALIDTYYPYKKREVTIHQRIADWVATHRERYSALTREERRQYVLYRISLGYKALTNWLRKRIAGDTEKAMVNSAHAIATEANTSATKKYMPQSYTGGAILFIARRRASTPKIVHEQWADLIAGPLELRPIPGAHDTVLVEPHVQGLAHALDAALAAARKASVRRPSATKAENRLKRIAE